MSERYAASDIADRAEQALAPLVVEAGFELLLCTWSGSDGRPTLLVYIEHPDGEGVGIEDCVNVHHAITDFLDAEDFIPISYVLQVSSPGLERPLKRPEHFASQLEKLVRVRTWEPIEERRNWKGTLQAVQDDIITVLVDGREHRIPIPAIEKANLVYEPPSKGQKRSGGRKRRR